MLGDAAPGLMFEDEIKDYIVEFGGALCKGEMPVVYIRGNHETRGEYAAKLPDYLGMDSFYFNAAFGVKHGGKPVARRRLLAHKLKGAQLKIFYLRAAAVVKPYRHLILTA